MKGFASLVLAVAIGVSFTQRAWAQGAELIETEAQAAPSVWLTGFDANDLGIQLKWTIRNDTDHDVWVCDSLTPSDGQAYEYFMDEDNETLVVRRRFGLPERETWIERYPPRRSRYVRLRPSQEKVESLSLATPVVPYRFLAGESGNADYARGLRLEIGFYDEDLPRLILQIVELAEKINCDLTVGVGDLGHIADRFFPGLSVAQMFEHGLGFAGSVRSDDDKVNLYHFGNGLDGEQVLRIEVAGVRIAYHDWDAEAQAGEAD